TGHWVVEHCVGTLGVGTLILKPLRHIVGLADMWDAEATELGPLMRRATSVIKTLTDADQVYACLWSHAEWRPGHIHFVLQPAWNSLRSRYAGPGPILQMAMFTEGTALDPDAVESFCARARSAFATDTAKS